MRINTGRQGASLSRFGSEPLLCPWAQLGWNPSPLRGQFGPAIVGREIGDTYGRSCRSGCAACPGALFSRVRPDIRSLDLLGTFLPTLVTSGSTENPDSCTRWSPDRASTMTARPPLIWTTPHRVTIVGLTPASTVKVWNKHVLLRGGWSYTVRRGLAPSANILEGM